MVATLYTQLQEEVAPDLDQTIIIPVMTNLKSFNQITANLVDSPPLWPPDTSTIILSFPPLLHLMGPQSTTEHYNYDDDFQLLLLSGCGSILWWL